MPAYEVISADRRTGQQQATIGRFDAPDAAIEEMRRRQQCEPLKIFYLFLYVTPSTKLIVNHTGY